MSAVKLLAGFIIGLIACAILLALISIRAPITIENAEGIRVIQTAEVVTTVSEVQKNTEQNENEIDIEDVTEEETDAVVAEESAVEEGEAVVEANIEDTTSEEGTEETEQATASDDEGQAVAEEEATDTKTAEANEVGTEAEEETQISRLQVGQGLQVGQNSLLTNRSSQGSRLRLDSETETTEPQVQTEIATPQPIGAFAQNAIEFQPTGQPLLSIILVDIGSQGVSQADLLKLDFPVSFALPSEASNIRFLQEDYWTAGFEVVGYISEDEAQKLLETGTDADDISSYVTGLLTEIPKALGIIDHRTARLQKDRATYVPILETLTNTGHGFFSYDVGINATRQSATELGLPSALIARILDGNDEDAQTIKNYLSNAAFAAQREGAVIVLGQSSEKTVTAIQEWMSSTAAASVTLSTLSAATAFQR